MKAVVTGSSGFLGRHFWMELRRRGYEVRGVDAQGKESYDARDFFRHTSREYDLAVHCAAVVGGRVTIEGAPLSQAVDLSLDAEFIQWVLRAQPRRAIYISSSAAYPVEIQMGMW